jgi:hypothetical protein
VFTGKFTDRGAEMISRVILASAVIAIFASTSIEASTNTAWDTPSNADYQPALLVAAKSKDRRDNRQDDRGRSDDREERRDCRDEEGIAGKDKRDCKQDSRTGKNDKDKDKDKDGGGNG